MGKLHATVRPTNDTAARATIINSDLHKLAEGLNISFKHWGGATAVNELLRQTNPQHGRLPDNIEFLLKEILNLP